jgi:antitoxin VapB
MPLFIRNDDVDALATKLQAATRTKTKTEAVRLALEHELQRVREKLPASERAAASIAIARTMGPGGGTFDMKAFTDEMWGGI